MAGTHESSHEKTASNHEVAAYEAGRDQTAFHEKTTERPRRDKGDKKWWDSELVAVEMREQGSMALPVVFAYAAQHALILVLFAFVGRSVEGENALAVAGLGSMWVNFSGVSIVVGLGSGLETLASQAYGAGKYRLVGVLSQRALVVLTASCVPIVFTWLFASPLLQAAGIEPAMADGVAEFTHIMCFSLPALVIQEVARKFLLAQGHMSPLLYCGALAFLIHVPCCYFLVQEDVLDIGPVRGGAVSLVLSYYVGDVLLLGYTFFKGLYVQTWHGWTREAFDLAKMSEYLHLAVPGAGQICLEWWCFEIQTLLSAQLGTTVLAAQTVMFNSTAIFYMMPLGISIACSARIGNALGAGNPDGARRAAAVAIVLCVVTNVVFTALYAIYRREWVQLFSGDLPVVDLTVSVIPIQASFLVFDAISGVNAGILRGCGNQRIGFLSNLLCFYLIGTPVGVYLAFGLDMGLHGLWLGLALGCCSQAATMSIYNIRCDWEDLADKAAARVERQEEDVSMRDLSSGDLSSAGGTRERDATGLLDNAA